MRAEHMSPITRRLQTAVGSCRQTAFPRERAGGTGPRPGPGILNRETPRSREQTDLSFLNSKDILSFRQELNYKLNNYKM